MFKGQNIYRLKYLITVVLNTLVVTILYFLTTQDLQSNRVYLLLSIGLLVSLLTQYTSKFIFNPREKHDGYIVIDVEDPNKDTITIEYDGNPLNMANKKTATFLVETKGL